MARDPAEWQKLLSDSSLPSAPGELSLIEVDVAGHEEIETAVAVIVAEGWRRVDQLPRVHASLLADIGEGAVVIVVVETVLAEVGDDRGRASRRCRNRRRRRQSPSGRW